MAEESTSRAAYACRRCGATYSFADYEKSCFCEKCGTFLKKASGSELLKLEKKKTGKLDFQRTVREFFPYSTFRPFQLDAIKFAFNTIKNGKTGLLSSPCGTGKSISVLTAFLMARESEQSVGKLLALTRTRNQLEIYCRELKNIKAHNSINLVASVFKSKKELCPYVIEDPKLRDLSYGDFLHYCKGLKEGVFGKTCRYYEQTYSDGKPSWYANSIVNKIKEIGPLLPEEAYEICHDKQLCPYEVTKILTKYADIIIGNYNYVLVDSIRGSVLGKTGLRTIDINCVFDEAHSLPYYAAGIFSDELSSTSVRRALNEVKLFDLDDFGLLDALHKIMIELGKRAYSEYGSDVEHVIEKDNVVSSLLKELNVSSNRLPELVSELSNRGEYIREKRAEAGRNPVSYVSRCAGFFSDWVNVAGSGYARYVKVEVGRDRRKYARLGIRCLDPSLAASVINELRSCILMSGTLWHTDYYIDVLGIERKRCESMELPNPFPSENRLILVDRAVTTKFEERGESQWKRIAEHLDRIIRQINGRVAVYFPSYEVMKAIVRNVKFDLPLIVEEKGTRIVDVLQFLKNHKQCAVFGVSRGKISEGVDMSTGGRSLLSSVIVVGLPYPKRTELQIALHGYFREKFGDKAMEYANDIPCLNALAQSAGRLLRSPEDRGIIVLMDERAAGRFKSRLPREWREEMKPHVDIADILYKISDFLSTC